jgi:hypothetical protein
MADLPKRELGRTGLQVTMLGYGSMELRGAPRARDTTEAQAETILNAVLDAGINFIDTSIDYGVSEERIGRYISPTVSRSRPSPTSISRSAWRWPSSRAADNGEFSGTAARRSGPAGIAASSGSPATGAIGNRCASPRRSRPLGIRRDQHRPCRHR